MTHKDPFDKKKMTNIPEIYFLGSGQIAVPILRTVAADPTLRLVGVGTQLDRPAGRNRLPAPTPVGAAAVEMGLQPEKIANVNQPGFLEPLRRKRPDILLVVSFGQILRQELLDLPRVACVNIHASLLPAYRGASPIVQALLNRDAATGVAFMKMERGLDTGPVYHSIRVELDHREYCDALEIKLGRIAGEAAPGILRAIAAGELQPFPQDGNAVTVCSKIRKSDGRVDWRATASEIDAMIRAYHPWPGAHCRFLTTRGEVVVTFTRVLCRRDLAGSPGEVLRADKYGLIIGCATGAIEVLELSAPGRKPMSAVDFLNGLRGEKPVILP